MRPTTRTLTMVAALLLCVLGIGYFYRPRIVPEFTPPPLQEKSVVRGDFAPSPQAEKSVTIELEPALEQRFGRSSIHLKSVEYEDDDIVVGHSESDEFIGYDKQSRKVFLYSPLDFAPIPPGLNRSDAIAKEKALALVSQFVSILESLIQLTIKLCIY